MWNAWIVRPPNAAYVSSTDSASLSPSVWIASWTSSASQMSSAVRIWSGPAETSSWIFSPAPPARRACRTGSGLGGGAADQQRRVERVRVERRPGGGEQLRRVAAEVPDRAGVLDDERRQPAGERGVRDLRGQPVHVRVDAAGRDDQAARVVHRGGGVQHDVDPVHRVRVAGAADAHDPAAAHADAGVPHPEHGVDDQAARDRDLHPAALRAHREAVAHRAAPAGDDRVRLTLGLEPQVAVGEAHALRHRDTPACGPAPGPRPARRPRRAGRPRARRARARSARPRSGRAVRSAARPG